MDSLHLNFQHSSGQNKRTSDLLSRVGDMATEGPPEAIFGLRDSEISSLSDSF